MRNATANSILFNVAEGPSTSVLIGGALNGAQVYVVSNGGVLYLSNDGATFSTLTTWARGYVRDAQRTGGGSLVWTRSHIPASNEPARLLNRDGSVIRALTGNLWSLISGDQDVVGVGLVY